MKSVFKMLNHDWHLFLLSLSKSRTVYVPAKTEDHIDYKLFTEDNLNIAYNVAKPLTPLKTFFLPIKANVVIEKNNYKKNVIIGIPACDLKAIEILDKIYLDPACIDLDYKERRENSVLIGTDCFETAENCHCTSYGIEPYPADYADVSLVSLEDFMIITIHSPKGEEVFRSLSQNYPVKEVSKEELHIIDTTRDGIKKALNERNKLLPDYIKTGRLIRDSGDEIWNTHAKACVSCGACTIACPTCTCFLLIDRPDFEKV